MPQKLMTVWLALAKMEEHVMMTGEHSHVNALSALLDKTALMVTDAP